MRGLAYFLGIASGFGLTLQIGMNSKLRTVLQNANTAALISFLVGTTGLVVLLAVTRTPRARARHAGIRAGCGPGSAGSWARSTSPFPRWSLRSSALPAC